ncbi:MAG: DUF2007 domain-containing protein [Defluviitaleaceae bacterium]|nr:DUF2007 domain-containing protein [Defluviitaleaceae bacterium]
MYSPKCKDEYQDDSPVFLCTLSDHMEVAMVEALLKSNNIPVVKIQRNGGDVNMLYLGVSFTDTDLYVPSKLLEHAKELLTPGPDDIIIDTEDDYGEAKEEYTAKRRNRAQWLFLLYFGIPIAIILITYIFAVLTQN